MLLEVDGKPRKLLIINVSLPVGHFLQFDPEVRRSMIELIGQLAEVAGAGLVAQAGRCCSVE